MPAAQTAETFLSKFPAGMADASVPARSHESENTLKFAFHAWADIKNRKTHGIRFNMPGRYAMLPRMELIFVPTFTVPKLRPKNGGFAVGKVTPFGISAAAGVGSDVEQRQQLPSETCQKLAKSYGEFGLRILESLTADTPEGKRESILLFEGVMRAEGEGGIKGIEVIQEDFPKWLAVEAPKMLDAAIKDGVFYEGETYRLGPSARKKGLRMIAEISTGAAATNLKALAVLKKTKKEREQAKSGVNDSKAILDDLDNFLLDQQLHSFSLDTDVDRATQASAKLAEAIGASGAENSETMRNLLTLITPILEDMAEKKAKKAA